MKTARFRRSSGFTLLELLVVIGIMGLLGTVAVGGYQAMVRAMEERGVMQNVNSFIRAAYQRAQIDRKPVAVYFWNETIRSRTADAFEVAVGRAVAVRRSGRISRKDGSVLVDEFADLDATYTTADESSGGGASRSTMRLYALDRTTGSSIRYSLVRQVVEEKNETVQFLGGVESGDTGSGSATEIPGYGFVVENANGVTWKQGMAYGFEFQQLQLPDGYIFGRNHSRDAGSPIVEAGTLVFEAGLNNNTGLNEGGVVGGGTIEVCALREKGAELNAVKIDNSDRPDRSMR